MSRSATSGFARCMVALAFATSACVADVSMDSSTYADEDVELGGSTSALTTTELFPSQAIAKGASRTGIYTATVAGQITFRTTGTGDVDLYVKKGAAPTTSSSDAKSEGSTSAESVTIPVAVGDRIHWLVYGFSASTASLTLAIPDAVASVTLVPSTSLARHANRTGTFTATVTGSYKFKARGTGDVDLYVRRNAPASTTASDAKGEGSTSTEDVTISATAGDVLHYYLFAFSASTASLVVEVPAAPSYDTVRSLATLSEAAAFTAFSTPGGGLSTSGRSLKFLIDNRTPSARSTSFINGNFRVNGSVPPSAKYHYDFARQRYGISDTVARFNETTYFSETKRFYAGNIQTYKLGAAQELVYAVQFYPDDVIKEASLLEALRTLKAAITIPGAKLAFVATGPQQTFATIGREAAALGVSLMTIDQVLGDIKFVPLNVGEAWGVLRIFPADVNLLRPSDLPVFDDLPLDLSVVAGTITRAYQDINSHVNLKAKERNTPNMVLRDAGPENAQLAALADQPVHLVVTNEGFTLEATTQAMVDQKLAEKLSGAWVALPIADETRLLSFDELCPTASAGCFDWSKTMGGKTTGLGFLVGALGRTTTPNTASATYGYDLSPRGFGIPVKYYRDFVNAPENTALRAKLDELVAAEKGGNLAPAERNALVAEAQALFYRAFVPGTLVADVTARLAAVLPGVDKFKFRSSATSEDVPNFNGAGLYDSFSIELGKKDNPDLSCVIETESDGVVTKLKIKPKTVQCGIKAVYASLWNARALVERTFGRLDHATAGMGVTINPSYGDEQANAVMVTRVSGTDAIYGYTLSIQKGENLVTNPLPGTITEFDVAAFSDPGRPARITTTRYAKPTLEEPVMTTTILTNERMLQLVDIAKTVETTYCRSKSSYFPGGSCSSVHLDANKPTSLDMEVKILPDGNIQFKQVREFKGR
jgi:hypothetical protein